MAAAAVGGGVGVGSGCLLEPHRLCTIQRRMILSNLPAIRPSIISISPSAKFTSNLSLRLRAQRRSSTNKPNTATSIPARDRVMEFGKHRGKMLGTLPSSFLRWISKNLRARDFEEWAKLADEVLEDPVYRDRIEWEYAEGVLNGNCMTTTSSSTPRRESAVSELLEISERFGWDNEDNEGWSRVNFELLGTSKGGRIPRRKVPRGDGRGLGALSRGADGGNGSGMVKRRGVDLESELSEEDKRRRRERRERLRLKRSDRPNLFGIGGGGLAPPQVTRSEVEVVAKKANAKAKAKVGGRRMDGREEEEDVLSEDVSSDSGLESSRAEEVYNPFPGRQGLLKKVIGLRQRRSL